MLWGRAGNCADNSDDTVLTGATPQAVLCSLGDGIAGPRTGCTDERARALFDTMPKNLDKAGLVLGAGHKVEPVGFLPKSGALVPGGGDNLHHGHRLPGRFGDREPQRGSGGIDS